MDDRPDPELMSDDELAAAMRRTMAALQEPPAPRPQRVQDHGEAYMQLLRRLRDAALLPAADEDELVAYVEDCTAKVMARSEARWADRRAGGGG